MNNKSNLAGTLAFMPGPPVKLPLPQEYYDGLLKILNDVDPETGELPPDADDRLEKHRQKYGIKIPNSFQVVADMVKTMSEEKKAMYSRIVHDSKTHMPADYFSDSLIPES